MARLVPAIALLSPAGVVRLRGLGATLADLVGIVTAIGVSYLFFG